MAIGADDRAGIKYRVGGAGAGEIDADPAGAVSAGAGDRAAVGDDSRRVLDPDPDTARDQPGIVDAVGRPVIVIVEASGNARIGAVDTRQKRIERIAGVAVDENPVSASRDHRARDRRSRLRARRRARVVVGRGRAVDDPAAIEQRDTAKAAGDRAGIADAPGLAGDTDPDPVGTGRRDQRRVRRNRRGEGRTRRARVRIISENAVDDPTAIGEVDTDAGGAGALDRAR
jgi:hypothetical protein